MYCKPKDITRKSKAGTLYSQSLAVTMILKHTVNYIRLNHQESKKSDQWGMLTMQFSLEFPEILSQNCICYNRLNVSGISRIMHCGILIIMPY